jgi:hypothetical protein
MWDACKLLWSLLLWLFRSRASLEAENLALRQQIIVLRRTAPKRLRFMGSTGLYSSASIACFRTFEMLWWFRPETIIRWLCVPKTQIRTYWWCSPPTSA